MFFCIYHKTVYLFANAYGSKRGTERSSACTMTDDFTSFF